MVLPIFTTNGGHLGDIERGRGGGADGIVTRLFK